MPITVTAPRVSWSEELTVESQPPACLSLYQQGNFLVMETGGRQVPYNGSRALTTYGQVVFPGVFTSTKRYKV